MKKWISLAKSALAMWSLPPAKVVSGYPDVRPLGDKKSVTLSDIAVKVRGQEWVIEKGSITDLGTYPWWSRWLYHWTEATYAAVWHDERLEKRDITKEEADIGWYQLAITASPDNTVKAMARWKALIAFIALRINDN